MKKYCVKRINNKLYYYRWEYRPTYLRRRSEPNKYKWIYVGPKSGEKMKKVFAKATPTEKEILLNMYKEKEDILLKEINEIEKLKMEEPYSIEYLRILKIKNRLTRRNELSKFHKNLHKIVRKSMQINQERLT